MLKLNNIMIDEYNRAIECVDVSDMDTVHDLMCSYINIFVNDDLTISERMALSILKRNVKLLVEESFDYRSDDFEQKLSVLSKSLENIPRCYITDPLFVLHEKCDGVLDNNNLLTVSQKHKSIDKCPIDFVLHKMYSEGYVAHQDMDAYKVSLEAEVYGLVSDLKLVDDMRVDKNTVPSEPQNHNTEVIHPIFHIVINMYEDYKTYGLDGGDNDVFSYTCTPSAIADKLYLYNINFNGIDGIDETDPIQVKHCQQVCKMMYTLRTYLEKLILNNDENTIQVSLYKLTKKYLDLLKSRPSITAMVVTKLIACCLIDSTHLIGVSSKFPCGTSTIKLLASILREIDQACLGIEDEDFRINPKCLLNFQYLCDVINRDCNLNNTDINDAVNEHMELLTNPKNEYVYITSMQSSSLDTYETSMNSLAEMFQVMSDGTIKVSIKEKTTYMNEYAMNHRLLVYNSQQKDYEAMKYNIVYHMILIDSIEKDVLYNKKIDKDSDLYKDAEQARRMAKSDIATYLPVIRRYSPSFNLNEMYKKVKADKATITIHGPETASGIKRIIKHILY